MWSCEIAWQTEYIISPLSRCLWLPNVAGWGHTMRSSHSKSCIIPQSSGLVRSRDKLKPLCLDYQNAYKHQTRQGDTLESKSDNHDNDENISFPF